MKHVALLSTLASLLLAVAAYAQPPGDICETALPLSVPDTVSGTTAGFNNDYNYLCDGGTETGADVVYVYTPATNDSISFNLCTGGTDFNTRLYIYTGSCESQQVIACDRYGCELYPGGWRSILLCVPLTAGTTYFVVIDGGTATEQGNYSLVTSTCPPPGDVCETALPIAIPDTVSSNNCIYTHQYDWICPYTWVVYSRDVVYSYVPAVDQRATFDLCNGTTNYDTKMFIYANTCAGNPIACNDDFCEAPHFGYSWVSRLEAIPLWAGTTYYIVVDAYWTYYCGDYTLVTSLVPPDPPQHLTICRDLDNAPHIVLRWNPSFGANLYYVYRDNNPSPECLLATTTDTIYVDSNAVSDPGPQYFYVVTAGIE